MSRACILLVLIAAGLLSAGCWGAEFARPTYDTVYMGQSADEVRMKLGKPAVEDPDRWIYRNQMPFYEARIVFKDGKVAGKSWSDERNVETRPAGHKSRASGTGK